MSLSEIDGKVTKWGAVRSIGATYIPNSQCSCIETMLQDSRLFVRGDQSDRLLVSFVAFVMIRRNAVPAPGRVTFDPEDDPPGWQFR